MQGSVNRMNHETVLKVKQTESPTIWQLLIT